MLKHNIHEVQLLAGKIIEGRDPPAKISCGRLAGSNPPTTWISVWTKNGSQVVRIEIDANEALDFAAHLAEFAQQVHEENVELGHGVAGNSEIEILRRALVALSVPNDQRMNRLAIATKALLDARQARRQARERSEATCEPPTPIVPPEAPEVPDPMEQTLRKRWEELSKRDIER